MQSLLIKIPRQHQELLHVSVCLVEKAKAQNHPILAKKMRFAVTLQTGLTTLLQSISITSRFRLSWGVSPYPFPTIYCCLHSDYSEFPLSVFLMTNFPQVKLKTVSYRTDLFQQIWICSGDFPGFCANVPWSQGMRSICTKTSSNSLPAPKLVCTTSSNLLKSTLKVIFR